MKRTCLNRWFAVAVCISVVILTDLLVSAQDATDSGLEIVKLAGTLQAVAGNRLKIKADGGQETIVMLSGDTTFEYTGTASPQFLAPGLMIRFAAAFDQSGMPQAEVNELEIFRPAQTKRPTRELVQSQTPGIYQVVEDKKAKTPPTNVTPGAQQYQVVGLLRMLQADKIQVAAGRQMIIVQMSPNVNLTVASGDAFFCQPGDTVTMTGLKNPGGLIQAETIKVKGEKPVGEMPDALLGSNSRQPPKPGEKGTASSKPKLPARPATPVRKP